MKNFLASGKASVLLDAQFGSTGKGLAAAYLHKQLRDVVDPDKLICMTNAAPNAGHTTVTEDGTKFVTFHMPTMGVLSPNSMIVLNAGAILDIDLLVKEVEKLGINPRRVFIHENAAVIAPEDKEAEKKANSSATRIASTQKGVGMALSRKVTREGLVAKHHAKHLSTCGFRIFDGDVNEFLNRGYAVMIETPQGMGLSLNNGFYPHCTSREVSVAQSLSDAGISPYKLHRVLATMRTFPIRVGNITDANGEELGFSGPVYPDQEELSWTQDFPDVTPERTTVTQRIRRIFTFSDIQYREALLRLRPDFVHVGFCDYFKSMPEFESFVSRLDVVEANCYVFPSRVFSFGPSVNDVMDYQQVGSWYDRRIDNG
jgi:adenylosuccinate synthase